MVNLAYLRRASGVALLVSLSALTYSPRSEAASCVDGIKSALRSLGILEKEALPLTGVLKNCAEQKLAAEVCDKEVLSWLKKLVDDQKLPKGTEAQLAALVKENPRLAEYLSDKDFVEYTKGVAQGKSLKELRPTLYHIWKKASNSDELRLTEAMSPEVLDIMKSAEAPFDGRKAGLAFSTQKFVDQLKGLPGTLDRIKTLVNNEMDPKILDSRVFDFYGYLNLELDASRVRAWKTVDGGYKAISLNDVRDLDPTTFSKVSMIAHEIEIPINPYSDNSGETLRVVSPQASRFMGKTTEEAIAHQGNRVYCTNSWCTEENRHANVLQNGATGLVGYKLKSSAPFDAYEGLDPLKPKDAFFHLVARNDTEWHAGSAYFYLGGHSDKALGTFMQNIREDEIKHMSLFGGLYKYIFGDTYQARLSGMLQKALHETGEKGTKSEFGDVFNTEPLSVLEILYTHVIYEKKIREFFKSLPLKSLRKIYETDVKLPPLNAVAMDAQKAEKIARATEQETSRRKALARWPKAQREAAEALEYFEINHKELLDKIIKERYATFKGAEYYKNPKHEELLADIGKLTPELLQKEYGANLTSKEVGLLKKSISDTIRDYQIMNNTLVRDQGLSVRFVDSHTGFDVVRDRAYERAKKVDPIVVDHPPTAAPAKVALLEDEPRLVRTSVLKAEKVNDSSLMVRVAKPEGLELKPGEAIRVTLNTPNGMEFRTLSLASSPSRDYFEFAVRDSDSEFKKAFKSLKPGQNVGLELTKGSLNFKPEEPAVMIAAGIGITPFRSFIQYVKDQNLKTPMTLLYGNRAEVAFGNELSEAAAQNSGLKVTNVLSKPDSNWQGERGRIDEEFLKKTISSLPENANYYIVGQPEMVNDTKKALVNLGISKDKVSVEAFSGYNNAAQKNAAATNTERKVAQEDPLADNQTVCFCHSVSAGTIRDAISNGASTLSDIQTKTMASTGCGSCECNVMGILQCESKKLVK